LGLQFGLLLLPPDFSLCRIMTATRRTTGFVFLALLIVITASRVIIIVRVVIQHAIGHGHDRIHQGTCRGQP